MNFDDFSMILGSFKLKTIALLAHPIDIIDIDWAFRCHSTRNVWIYFDYKFRLIALWISAFKAKTHRGIPLRLS